MIYVCEPLLDGRENEYLMDCLNTNWISSNGKYNALFEEMMCQYLAVPFAVTCSSCTAALYMALTALGISKGDEVIIPDFTLIVSANTVIQTGATPVLVDVDPYTWCIDPSRIEERITPNTRAIMAVHMYGHPCNMPAILEIARKHGLYVIEDCAEAHGAEIYGQKVGSFGDAACFSFYANKIVTTGEGGMVVCKDDEVAANLKLLRNQGFQEPRFVHSVLGYNYRMTNMQAAIGVAQMERIEDKVARKRWIAARYQNFLESVSGVTLPSEAPWAKNVYWMYGVVLGKENSLTKNDIMKRLMQEGIETRSFFCPMHLQPVYQDRRPGYPDVTSARSNNVSRWLWEQGFYLPTGLELSEADIQLVCDKLTSYLVEA